MLPMIAAVLLTALPGGPMSDLRPGQVHWAVEAPRMHAAPDTLLDDRLSAALQMLPDSAGFPESPILFTESVEILGRRGSVLDRDGTLAVLDRVSVRLGHRVESRVLDVRAECDVVIVPEVEGRLSGQACRDAEGTLRRALSFVVTRHDEEQTTIQVSRWSVALAPVFNPVRVYVYAIEIEGRGAELEARMRAVSSGSYRYPDGIH